MSEKTRSNFILVVVIVVVAATIVIAVTMRPGAKPADPMADETVDQEVAVSNDDASTDVDEPEAEPVKGPAEITVEEKPEPVTEVAPTTKKPKEVAKQPQEVADEIEDIMAALEYREDFCPEGWEPFDMGDMGEMGTNPGYVEGEMLEGMSEQLGGDVEIQRMYICMLTRGEMEQLGYFILEVASADDAVTMEKTVMAKIGEEEDAFVETFTIRNYVVMAGGEDEVADTVKELMGKLKRAVNYTD